MDYSSRSVAALQVGFAESWLAQVNALTRKNIHLLWGKKIKTFTIIILP